MPLHDAGASARGIVLNIFITLSTVSLSAFVTALMRWGWVQIRVSVTAVDGMLMPREHSRPTADGHERCYLRHQQVGTPTNRGHLGVAAGCASRQGFAAMIRTKACTNTQECMYRYVAHHRTGRHVSWRAAHPVVPVPADPPQYRCHAYVRLLAAVGGICCMCSYVHPAACLESWR